MIQFVTGNILESQADALINTVNTEGVMGKGIALQFKNQFPHNYKIYREACKKGEFNIGDLLVVEEETLLLGKKWIINFPTKTTWRKPSEYMYIEKGLDKLVNILLDYPIKTLAIPPLGSGNGGLDWNKVKTIMQSKLKGLPIEITIYEPNRQIKEKMRQERVKLTEARAMLLFMLYKLVRNGEFVSEFSSEKLCYFLQRFGGKKYFKLEYQPNFYGPYSGKVRHVLNYLNGSYIMGYSGMDKGPFEVLNLVSDGEPEVLKFIESNEELKNIVTKTDAFLNGFYSDFGLELLSSLDFIMQSKGLNEKDSIRNELEQWNDRKRTMFSDERFIEISLSHLQKDEFVSL